jgi:ATP-dependent Lon protease
MTGEISLRGLVLPIGGVKEKVLAAIQAGITTVMLPARNRRDIEDVPEKARNLIRFVFLEHVDDAIDTALNPPNTREPERARTSHTEPPERQVARSR